MTPTEQILKEIEERCSAATEGKWEVARSNDRTAADIFVEEKALICEMSNVTLQNEQMQTNADFIAASRTDLPKLLRAFRVLWGDNKECCQCSENVQCLACEVNEEAEKILQGEV